MPLPWQRTFCHCRKCVLHIYTHAKTNIWAKFYDNRSKTEQVVRVARFTPNFIMPLPWQRTFCHCRKMCLAHLHPKANICAKFHENRSKTEEVVRHAIFPPICCHNMPLPWQRTFCHCQKCVLHIYTHAQTNIWAKFYDNRSKTEQVVRVARFTPNFTILCRYHGNALSVTVEKCVLHIFIPRQTSVPNSMRIGQKLRK